MQRDYEKDREFIDMVFDDARGELWDIANHWIEMARAENNSSLKEKFWVLIEPSIRSYSSHIDKLLDLVPTPMLQEYVSSLEDNDHP